MQTRSTPDLRQASRKFQHHLRLGALVAGALCCSLVTTPTHAAADLSPQNERSLKIAFGILEGTLSGEASLKWLLLYKKIVLQGPKEAISNVLTALDKASNKRAEELDKLRSLDPPILGDPPPSPMGDAIQAAAEEAGTEELILSHHGFDVRFLFLQAQATRMISVVAAQAAKIDPNEKRRKWLTDLSDEFEGYRNTMVKIAESCANT